MYSVEFAYNIVPSDEAGQGLSNLLIRQLAAIESGKGLQQAARSLGVSYRYFWGQIEIWEERFGQKLVIREQGKRARLSPLGQKLLWAERTVMANYAVHMEKMRTELNAAFAAACQQTRTHRRSQHQCNYSLFHSFTSCFFYIYPAHCR